MARWNRKKYPPNWEEMSYNFRASKDFTCEHCGYRQGDELVSKAGRTYRGTVDAAHKFPYDEDNPDPELLCLCKRDHRIYDNTVQAEWAHVEDMMEIAQWEYCDVCEARMPPSHFPHGTGSSEEYTSEDDEVSENDESEEEAQEDAEDDGNQSGGGFFSWFFG